VKLPIDTSAIAFLCALAPEPVVDFETRRPKADENGEPLYVIQLLAMGDGSADLIAVKVGGVPSPAIRQGAPVKVTGLVAQPPGPWPTAPGSRSAPSRWNRPWPLPKRARREGCPSRRRAEGPAQPATAVSAPPTHPGRVLATPDPSCIRSEPRDAP
jgi:hypothetical protein